MLHKSPLGRYKPTCPLQEGISFSGRKILSHYDINNPNVCGGVLPDVVKRAVQQALSSHSLNHLISNRKRSYLSCGPHRVLMRIRGTLCGRVLYKRETHRPVFSKTLLEGRRLVTISVSSESPQDFISLMALLTVDLKTPFN